MLFYGLLIGSIFTSLLYGIHIFVAFIMIVIILMQASKGGGLSGAFGTGTGSSPLFGAATSTVLVRTTTVLAVIFAITCLSLATIQARRSPIPKAKKSTEEVEKETTGKEEPPVAVEKEAAEKKEEEGALSPVEAGAEEKEKGAAEGEEPSPPEEKPLSPVEAEPEVKEKGAAQGEEPSLPKEKPLSPVEGDGEETEEKQEPPAAVEEGSVEQSV